MNTADRSVEALDTALRRRFYFEEIFPKPELLTPQRMLWQFWWDKENYSWDNEEYVKMETPFYKLLGFPEDKNNEKEKGIYWDPMRAEDKPDEKQIELLDDFVQTFNGVNLSLLLTFINRRIEKLLSKDYMIGHAYLINVRSIEDLKIAFFNKIMPLLQEYFYGDYGRIGLVIGTSFLEGIENSSVGFMEVKGYDVGDLNDNRVYKIKKADDFSSDDEFVASIKTIYAVK
jgi:5-methylcytosine-specific restriction protein B